MFYKACTLVLISPYQLQALFKAWYIRLEIRNREERSAGECAVLQVTCQPQHLSSDVLNTHWFLLIGHFYSFEKLQ